jgi:hypothetical protein
VRNKPNSAEPAGGPGPWRGKMCETNPIWAGSAGTGGTERAKRTQFQATGQDPTANRAKRTQFRGVGRLDATVGCTNKANSRSSGRCIGSRTPNSLCTPSFQYSIIPPLQSMAYRAKRSQFPAGEIPHHSTILSCHHSNPIPVVHLPFAGNLLSWARYRTPPGGSTKCRHRRQP